jgi:amidohydrolase
VKHPINSAAAAAYPQAVALRRTLHANPELSGHEIKTARLVHESLARLGLSPRYCCGRTGVAVRLTNGKGKTVVLRADLDGLPIEEKTGLQFSSRNKGVMHACGHDMHAACLVGAAHAFLSCKNLWKGTIILLFQPSEEQTPGGALAMIREGVFPENADAVFGLHVSTDHPTGVVGLKSGADYAGVIDFDVIVKVKGGHGAAPDTTADPIVCCCAMIQQLQTLVSRESPCGEPSVVTVGTINAGTKHNIIPAEARFSGTIRALSDRHLEFLRKRFANIVLSIAHSFKAKAGVAFEKSYPPGHNDSGLVTRAHAALCETFGAHKVVMRTIPTMLSEDFAYFQKKARGVYVHLGVRPARKKNVPGIHTSDFVPDERAMLTGIAVHVALAIDILKNNGTTTTAKRPSGM